MLNVACALIIKDSMLLLAQLGANSAHPFQWEFPGGKIRRGESAESCIKREIREELDISIEIIVKLIPVVYDHGFRKIELIPFLCSTVSNTLLLNAHVDFKWIKLNQLNDFNMAQADKKLIEVGKNMLILKKYLGEKMDYS